MRATLFAAAVAVAVGAGAWLPHVTHDMAHAPFRMLRELQAQPGNANGGGGGGGNQLAAGCNATTAATDNGRDCCAAQGELMAIIQACPDVQFGMGIQYWVMSQRTGMNASVGRGTLAPMCASTCWGQFRNLLNKYSARNPMAPSCIGVHLAVPTVNQLCDRDQSGVWCAVVNDRLTAGSFVSVALPGGAGNVTRAELAETCNSPCTQRAIAQWNNASRRIGAASQEVAQAVIAVSSSVSVACARAPGDDKYCTERMADFRASPAWAATQGGVYGDLTAGDLNVFTAPEFACSHCGRVFTQGYYDLAERGARLQAVQNAANMGANPSQGQIQYQNQLQAQVTQVAGARGLLQRIQDMACAQANGKFCSRAWAEMQGTFDAMMAQQQTGARLLQAQQQQVQPQGTPSRRPGGSIAPRPSEVPPQSSSLPGAAFGLFSCMTNANDFLTSWSSDTGTCTTSCRNGVQAAFGAMGCCLRSYLDLQAMVTSFAAPQTIANGQVPVPIAPNVTLRLPTDSRAMFDRMAQRCQVTVPQCGASIKPRIANRLANMRLNWLTTNATRMEQFKAAYITDLARATGQSPTYFNITELREGSVIVVTTIVAPSDDIATAVQQQTQTVTSSGSFAPAEVLTLVSADPTGALENPNAEITSSDTTAAAGVGTALPTPSPSFGSSPSSSTAPRSGASTAGVSAVVAAVALAAAVLLRRV